MQLHNKCVGRTRDGVLRYEVVGNRMSGDMNTGLGNVQIMCALMYTFFEDMINELEAAGRGRIRLDLVNNGDDCSIICEAQYEKFLVQRLDAYFLSYGFEMDVEGVARVLEQLKFCQSHPIWTPQGYRMVRHAHTAIAKDAINLGVVRCESDYTKWRAAIAGCGLALTSGIPIMQSYYLGLASGSATTRNEVFTTGMEFLARGMESKTAVVHEMTRVSFYDAFGISPALQVELENHYESIPYHYAPTTIASVTGVTGNASLPF
jgi:hypothetical protein